MCVCVVPLSCQNIGSADYSNRTHPNPSEAGKVSLVNLHQKVQGALVERVSLGESKQKKGAMIECRLL